MRNFSFHASLFICFAQILRFYVGVICAYSSSNELLNDFHIQAPNPKNCLELLHNFSTSASDFSSCLLDHSAPANFCMSCSDFYLLFERTFVALSEDLAAANEDLAACVSSFDGFPYAKKTHKYLTEKFWADANCQGCLIYSLINISEPGPIYKYNQFTLEIIREYDAFKNCVAQFNDSKDLFGQGSICQNCSSEFHKVQSGFKRVFENKEKFCSDATSLLYEALDVWHKKSNCSIDAGRSNVDPIEIKLLWIFVFVVPAVFYLAVWLFASNQKRVLRKYQRMRWKSGQSHQRLVPDEETDILRPNIEAQTPKEAKKKRQRVLSYSQIPPSQLG